MAGLIFVSLLALLGGGTLAVSGWYRRRPRLFRVGAVSAGVGLAGLLFVSLSGLVALLVLLAFGGGLGAWLLVGHRNPELAAKVRRSVNEFLAQLPLGGPPSLRLLGKRVVSEVECNVHFMVGGSALLGNDVEVRLSPTDFANVQRIGLRDVKSDLEQAIRESAQRKGWRLAGPPRVGMASDETCVVGWPRVRVTASEMTAADETDGTTATTEAFAGALLEPVEGTTAQFVLDNDGRNVIGRSDLSTLRVDEATVSGSHCEIYRQVSSWVVRDLGSKNGTWVNGERVVDSAALSQDDLLGLGKRVVFKFTERSS